jgi:hypothetical protein
MQLRHARFGTVEYAHDCDRRARGLVHVGRSRVCAGVGVFASCDVPSGTVMTAYPFVRRGCYKGTRRRAGPHDADYEFEWDEGTSLDGHPSVLAALPRHRRPTGCAHLVNDAIHREVTGCDNNCDFIEDHHPSRPRLHIVTTRSVRRGEELLVSYSLGYWLSRGHSLHPRLRGWIACHRRVRRALPQLWLWDYIGTFGEAEGDEHLVYMASCSERSTCTACATGNPCVPRRVEIRWASLGMRGGDARMCWTDALSHE